MDIDLELLRQLCQTPPIHEPDMTTDFYPFSVMSHFWQEHDKWLGAGRVPRSSFKLLRVCLLKTLKKDCAILFRCYCHHMSLPMNKIGLDIIAANGCQVPNCTHKHESELYFRGRCHPSAGVSVSYAKNSGILRVTCKECDAPIVDIKVAE